MCRDIVSIDQGFKHSNCRDIESKVAEASFMRPDTVCLYKCNKLLC